MATKLRIVHYINQFFGGIGGEDKADTPPSHRAGPVGPGLGLAKALGADAEIVGTLICGDNWFVEHEDAAVATLLEMAAGYGCDVLVAGPAFSSGRYGTACGTLAAAWEARGRPAVIAMNVNNPGVELFRERVLIVKTGPTAAAMAEALPKLAALAVKRGRGIEPGPADDEGYFPRGVRRLVRLPQDGASARSTCCWPSSRARPIARSYPSRGSGRCRRRRPCPI